MWIFRIIIIFIQTKIRNISESTLKLEKIWNGAITQTKTEADTWNCQLLGSQWRSATVWSWSLSAQGYISEIEQRSAASICPRKQPQASRIRYIPRHAHLQSKPVIFSLHYFPSSKNTHLQHSLQDPAAALLPSPINCVLRCNSHTGRQYNCNTKWYSWRNPLSFKMPSH